MIGHHWYFLIAGMILLSSCGEQAVAVSEITTEDDSWTYDQHVRIDFNVTDTTDLYDLSIEVTHGTEYQWQNLYVQIQNIFPNGDTMRRNVSLELADKKGQWQGDCSGERCEAVIDLQSKFFFPQEGNYSIMTEQFMREDSIRGIESVRLRLSRHNGDS